MDIIQYDHLKETLYKEVLANGLTVFMLPKQDYYKTYALFSTDFGSIDQEFKPLNDSKLIQFPNGIAHFLEHKMFEKEEGDVFDRFSNQGASANAFTSFTNTGYLFSSTSRLKENIHTLLDFVQKPYFTDETVKKEKGIIAQEIQMYDDLPEWRVLFGLLENLYPNHPASIDIAGTVESIQDITAEMLYQNYSTFYHPCNMQLFITGNIDPEETLNWIKENQASKVFSPPEPIIKAVPEDSSTDCSFNKIEMSVNKPKVLVGVKGKQHKLKGIMALKQVILIEFLLKLLFGETSSTYLRLYDEGLIDDSFDYDYTFERSFDFISVGGDTKEPDLLADILQNLLQNAAENPDLNERHFQTVKKRSIGQVLQSLNSLEFIAHRFSDLQFGDATIFDVVPLMEEIQLDEVKSVVASYMLKECFSTFQVLPESE